MLWKYCNIGIPAFPLFFKKNKKPYAIRNDLFFSAEICFPDSIFLFPCSALQNTALKYHSPVACFPSFCYTEYALF